MLPPPHLHGRSRARDWTPATGSHWTMARRAPSDRIREPMPDRHVSKSKYTADRNIPGAFDGETVTRRR